MSGPWVKSGPGVYETPRRFQSPARVERYWIQRLEAGFLKATRLGQQKSEKAHGVTPYLTWTKLTACTRLHLLLRPADIGSRLSSLVTANCSVKLPPSCSDTPSVAEKEMPRGALGSGCRDLLPETLNSGLGSSRCFMKAQCPFLCWKPMSDHHGRHRPC